MSTLILTDFSKTLTAPTAKTTWSLFKESGLFPKDYAAKRDELFETYRPFELEGDNEMVGEWFGKHLDLLAEYGAMQRMTDVVHFALDEDLLVPRQGFGEFFDHVRQKGIVVRVVSSGISELIQRFLATHGVKYPIGFPDKDSCGIFGNDILEHDGIRSVRTPADKMRNLFSLFEGFDRIIVLGDSPEDFAIP